MAATVQHYLQDMIAGNWDERLGSMYGEARISEQKDRYAKLLSRASKQLQGDVVLVSACGRDELGGNHTDHNHGNVMAAGVHLDHLAVATKEDEMWVNISSEGFPGIEVDLNNLSINEAEFGKPEAIIRGVAAELKQAGYKICGFSAVVTTFISGLKRPSST